MSHLHIPDGVLAPIWLVLGFVLTFGLVMFAVYRASRQDNLSISRIGAVSAFMLLAMSVPLGFLPVHLNLAVLAGIVLGPWQGVIAIFVVNFLLALIGHGGMTVLGINTLVISGEMLLGYGIFSAMRRKFRPSQAAAVATVIALASSMSAVIGLFVALRADPAILFHTDEAHHALVHVHAVSLPAVLRTILPVNLAGIALESLVVAGITSYVDRVRPDLLWR